VSESIEKLDPNFQSAEVDENGVRWCDARELTLEGIGWPGESQAYCRLPDRAEGVVRDAVWQLSRHSAGACVRFVSDAQNIVARWTLRNENLAMAHMPASGVSGLDLYARDATGKWRWAGVGIPSAQENEAVLLNTGTTQEREYAVYLPLYNGTAKLEIGAAEGASLKPAPPRGNPRTVGFYGTSIVHGGCASRPGMAYPAIFGRALDCATINLGFSGNGQGEAEVAELLAELDADVWVLDPLPNMSADLVRERIGNFAKTLRTARPQAPIVLVENIEYQNGWLNAARRDREESSNAALREVYDGLCAAKVNDLHYVEGASLLGDDGEGTVDGTHPTDVGFARMAGVLLPVVRPLVNDSALPM
jgi:lysophospholipase L1-like esterase